jgi:hypothetical protein
MRLIRVSGYPTSVCRDTGAILVPSLEFYDALGWISRDDDGYPWQVWKSVMPFRWAIRRWLAAAHTINA